MTSVFRAGFLLLIPIGILVPLLNAAVCEKDDLEEVDILKESAPRVFLDCQRCDTDYIRTEIAFVNYVRDRQEADVHILMTVQSTGSGGREYAAQFIGQKECADMRWTLRYVSSRTETEDATRKGLVHVLKLGLAPYVARTPMGKSVIISLARPPRPTAVSDRWNFWVFNVGFNNRLSGEKTRSSVSLSGDVSANRVTPASKVQMALSIDIDRSHFDYEETEIISTSESRDFFGLFVKSLNEHWSVGGWASLNSSTYRNLDLSTALQPALEYNFFPYSESTRRQLRALYRIGFIFNRYLEETVYEKTRENLFSEALSLSLDLVEPWGNAGLSTEFSHYFHDFSKKRFSFFGDLSLRVFKGLSVDFFGSFSALHDQLSLRKGDASLDEVLLRRRELASGYRYVVSFGLSYSFGSVFSNVVNPRFGMRMRGRRY
ncbi:MAG: hypothetical protein FJY81_03910 [Candidatus Aminicenantes bacterium]|nr:hypothetical protein [Candidatus Aminicenantes bacterium]